MFSGCSSLNEVTCFATDISAEGCTYNWLSGVAPTGTFNKSILMNDWTLDSPSGIPEGWTVNEVPVGTISAVANPAEGGWVNGVGDYYYGTTCVLTTVVHQGYAFQSWTEGGEEVSTDTRYEFVVNGNRTLEANYVPYDYSNEYFTLESLVENNTVTFSIPSQITSEQLTSVSYSTDGANWTTVVVDDTDQSFSVIMDAGEKLYLKGNGTQYGKFADDYYYSNIATTGDFIVYGNIMSLLYGDGFASQTAFPDNSSHTFYGLFRSCNRLVSAANLVLPAITLASDCYRCMFQYCTSLTWIPTLPATTLAEYCYRNMFYGCTSLTEAPELPVTVMESDCYYGMFSGCTSLTEAPALPATTLAGGCYSFMFYGCTSLTEAPELPATTLASGCYDSMFHRCTSLTEAPLLPATTLASDCYGNMFSDCTSLTEAPALPATTLANHCYSFMFLNCTSLTEPPVLPATTLKLNCYGYMFYGCSSLNKVTCLATDNSAMDCTTNWLYGVANTGTFHKSVLMEDWILDSPSGIPVGWSVNALPCWLVTASSNPAEGGTVAVGTETTGEVRSENFEQFTVGNKIAEEAIATGDECWTTWGNAPGGAQDGIVAEFDGTQCAHFTYGNDQVLLLGNITTGVYELSFDMYIPNGKNAYNNILHIFNGSNSQWVTEVYYNHSSKGTSIQAGGDTTDFACPFDTWFNVKYVIDLDNDNATFHIDDVEIVSWQFSLQASGSAGRRRLAAMDFYPPENDATSEFYIDNISVVRIKSTAGFVDGSTCTLTATPNEGYVFANWTENEEVVSNDAEYTFMVTETRTLVANFVQNNFEITVVADPSYGGTVTGEGYYYPGQTATLTATPNEGFAFLYWTKNGLLVSNNPTYSFVVTGDATYVANFEGGDYTQTSTFASGWTWWSANVELSGMDGLTMLEQGLGDDGYLIKSQTSYVSNNVATGWSGSLEEINNESSYMVNALANIEVSLTGNVAMPYDHPVTLSNGWTWIGYPSTLAMSVEDAMSGIDPANGDLLKSQTSFASYNPSQGWSGSLNTLEPSKGYMYLSKTNGSVVFYYPEAPSKVTLQENLTSENNHWSPDMQAYPNNMSVMAVVELDGVELHDDAYELAAFAGEECRGSVRLMEVDGRHLAFLTVTGDTPQDLSLRLYDATTGQEWHHADEVVTFASNAVIGSLEAPVTVHFRGNASVGEVLGDIKLFPNPVWRGETFGIESSLTSGASVKVEIINALGTVVSTVTSTRCPETLVAPKTAGVYTVRITVDGLGTCCKKLVVK